MVDLSSLETPIAVIDLERVRRNLRRVADYCQQHRLRLRPHTKTHKHPALGRLQLDAGAAGLTVATAREADVMAEVCDDLLVAYPPVDPARLDRLTALHARHAPRLRIECALDSGESLERLSAAAQRSGAEFGVLIELDMGSHRTGVSSVDALLRLAEQASRLPSIDYRGILFHPGHVRRAIGEAASVAPFEAELQRLDAELARYLEALHRAGFTPAVVSGGNTPTLFDSHRVAGLTEIRPGTYVFWDRDTTSQRVNEWTDCAYSVLTTVVSTSVAGQAVVDAGSKSLAKESLPEVHGFGALLDRPDVVVKSLSEEHGLLDLSNTSWRPRVGDRLRIVPNHVCVSVNLQDRVAFLDGASVELSDVPGRGRQ